MKEHITFLFHMRGDGGSTRLLAGTRSRLYSNTGNDGNWRILYEEAAGDREGAVPETRFRAAQLGNIAIITNGFSRPLWYGYEAAPDPVTGGSARLIDDLVALGITSARVVSEWRGFAFLANTVTEGEINLNRIYWSDFNAPLDWIPLPDSLAGYVDLAADERVLAMAPLGGQFRVYTDKAVYEVNLVGGAEVFNFRELYRGPEAMRFENSLVNLGDIHIYAGESSLHTFDQFERSPRTHDWVYRAAGAIYEGVKPEFLDGLPEGTMDSFGPLNREFCHNFTGGHDEANGLIWFSWPCNDDADGVPTKSLVLQPSQRRACFVDAGYTAFAAHVPTYGTTWRRFLGDIGACLPIPLLGEGNPMPRNYVPNPNLQYIRNPTEDPSLPPAENSLCSEWLKGDDGRVAPAIPDCTPCGSGWVFVAASSADRALKMYQDQVFFRERLTNGVIPTPEWSTGDHPTFAGDYVEDGYISFWQTDAADMGSQRNKTIQGVVAEYDAPADPDGGGEGKIHVQVGYGSSPRNLLWQDSAAREIQRPYTDSEEASYRSGNVRPNTKATFPFLRTGAHIAVRMIIGDAEKRAVKHCPISVTETILKVRPSHGVNSF
jgi:hypothetical protein